MCLGRITRGLSCVKSWQLIQLCYYPSNKSCSDPPQLLWLLLVLPPTPIPPCVKAWGDFFILRVKTKKAEQYFQISRMTPSRQISPFNRGMTSNVQLSPFFIVIICAFSPRSSVRSSSCLRWITSSLDNEHANNSSLLCLFEPHKNEFLARQNSYKRFDIKRKHYSKQ